MLPKQLLRNYTSKAKEENFVLCDKARFTVLSESLIRMEFDNEACFEDRATQSVINRQFEISEFTTEIVNEELVIRTACLELHYNSRFGFTPKGLFIKLLNMSEKDSVWHFGDTFTTLGGTCRTLDGAGDPHPLESFELGDGVCSRDGYSVFDDSKSLIISDDGWFKPRKKDTIDLYFFGFGHNYIDATKAFYSLTGFPPLLPSYAFGNWWSRFYSYNQQSYQDLMTSFSNRDIPFTVAVIDMDWHWSRSAFGKPWYELWTGYSWNKKLFPKPLEFLDWLHKNNLHPALNLHPARGIQNHEDMYEEMALAMGIEPKSKKAVEFQPANKDFWGPYFDIVHHPHEESGVDFWWMDWQQGTTTDMSGLDPLWALNYFHSLDCERSDKRPMFFSRYSGPGSQRFYVGFSGDTQSSWDVLKFEAMFTATAANIGYPYWSHDIGGFHGGIRDDELYARWVQFGVFSPICRLHSSDNDFMSKEPWNFEPAAEKAASEALRMRHSMFPYLYTMNYRTHTEGLPLCMPLYYLHTEEECAYKYKNEYYFGSELIFSPITEKCNPITKLAKNKLWLPEGMWIDYNSGLIYEGGREITVYKSLDDFPLFCKAGAIIPFNTHICNTNTQHSSCDMDIYIFPGADNIFKLYEDEGVNNRYLEGHYATTEFSTKWNNKKTVFKIAAASGDTLLLPKIRNYSLNFVAFSDDAKVTVRNGDNDELSYNRSFDKASNTMKIFVSNVSTAVTLEIIIENEEGVISKNTNLTEKLFELLLRSQISNNEKMEIYDIACAKELDISEKIMKLSKKEDVETELIDAIKELLILGNQ